MHVREDFAGPGDHHVIIMADRDWTDLLSKLQVKPTAVVSHRSVPRNSVEFDEMVAPFVSYPSRGTILLLLTHRDSSERVAKSLSVAAMAAKAGVTLRVVIVGPARDIVRAFDAIMPSPEAESRMGRMTVHPCAGRTEAALTIRMLVPQVDLRQPCDDKGKPLGAKVVHFQAVAVDRRRLAVDISVYLRNRVTLEHLRLWTDGVLARIQLYAFAQPQFASPEHVREIRCALREITEPVSPDTDLVSLDDRQLQRFTAPCVSVEWKRIPPGQSVLSTVSPLAFEHHAPVVGARIVPVRTRQSTKQNALVEIGVGALTNEEVKELKRRLKTLKIGGRFPAIEDVGPSPPPPHQFEGPKTA